MILHKEYKLIPLLSRLTDKLPQQGAAIETWDLAIFIFDSKIMFHYLGLTFFFLQQLGPK